MYKNVITFVLYSLALLSSVMPACTPSATQCGCSRVKPLLSETKIVGGYVARNNSWPWIVNFRRGSPTDPASVPGSAFCGGSLISDKLVLTAAHCVNSILASDLPDYFVVVGAIFINDTNPARFYIRSITTHPSYNQDTQENDIALVELVSPVNFNDPNVGFVCLPPRNLTSYPSEGMNSTAIGWGRLVEGGLASYTLQQVQMPIVSTSNQYCVSLISDPVIQFCAGLIAGGKDTCQGDSGGPLMVYNATSDTWVLAGITSYGDGCAEPGKPGVYSRVSAYIDWAYAYVQPHSSSTMPMANEFLLFSIFIILFF